MFFSEIKNILKTKTTKMILLLLLLPSAVLTGQILIETPSAGMDGDSLMAYMDQQDQDIKTYLDVAEKEARISSNPRLGGTSKKGKAEALILAQEENEAIETTKNKILSMDEKEIDEIKKAVFEFLVIRHFNLARRFGVEEKNQVDPLIVFEKEIEQYEFLHPLKESQFDYDAYAAYNGSLSVLGLEGSAAHYEDSMKQLEIDFYKYAHGQMDLGNNECASICASRLSNQSMLGLLALFLATIFFYLNALDFRKTKMNILYCSLSVSRTKIYLIKLFALFVVYGGIVFLAFFLPVIACGVTFGFENMLEPALIDTGFITSYRAHADVLYDGYVQYSPCLSQVAPGNDMGYPFLNLNLAVIPLGIQLLIQFALMIMEILCVGIFVYYLAMCIKRSSVIVGICLFGILLTRIQYVPVVSLIPLFYPNPPYLLAGGHGIGWIPLISMSVLFILFWFFAGVRQYRKTLLYGD